MPAQQMKDAAVAKMEEIIATEEKYGNGAAHTAMKINHAGQKAQHLTRAAAHFATAQFASELRIQILGIQAE